MNLFLAMALLGEAVILKPVANMYSQPTEEADVVSQALFGANVGIVEEKGDWLKIRTADEYTGWAPVSSLRRTGPNDRAYAISGKVAEVAALAAHLYREPSVTKRQPLITLPFESKLEVVAEPSERWIQVRLPDDRSAFVQRGDVSLAPARLDVPAAVLLSQRFLGLPYTWGGTSSFGYDCSGFTQMMCRRRGIAIPRDAKPQALWEGMDPVGVEQLEPGDLLYFGDSMQKITHTGMWIGEGQFIHSTTHERPVLQISRLDDPHWTKLLVCARRPK